MEDLSSKFLTVIIPTYNHGKFVSAAIESALIQRTFVLKVIVVDDGSKDGTREYLLRLYRNNQRVKLVFLTQNQGIYNALIAGMSGLSTKYFAFLAADDVLLQEWAHVMQRLTEQYPDVGFYHCDSYRLIEDTGEIYAWKLPYKKICDFIQPEFALKLIKKNGVCFPSNGVVYNAAHWANEMLFEKAGPIGDKVGLMSLAIRFGYAYTKERLCLSREISTAMSASLTESSELKKKIAATATLHNNQDIKFEECTRAIIVRAVYGFLKMKIEAISTSITYMLGTNAHRFDRKITIQIMRVVFGLSLLVSRVTLLGFRFGYGRIRFRDSTAEELQRYLSSLRKH